MPPAGGVAAFNALWAGVIVEELVRLGVDRFAIAPGSRSTPLTLAATRHPKALCMLHLDERAAAFWALGQARGSGRPAVVICTSGTAAANFLPAAVEAAMDDVPLLLLTADRPAELRDSAANQTVHQPGMFGGFVRWAMDLPAPDRGMHAASLLTAVDQAVHRATADPAGPVHLNLPFREPLSGEAPDPADPWLDAVAAWRDGARPFTRYATAPHPAPLPPDDPALAALAAARRGLVTVGRLPSRAETQAAARIAARLGWPVVADAGSGLKGPDAPPALIRHADLILRQPARRAALAPDTVLHIGAEAVSKPLAQFLDRVGPVIVRAAPDPRRRDPGHGTAHRLVMGAEALEAALAGLVPVAPEASWKKLWAAADATVADVLGGAVDGGGALDEPAVARWLAGGLPEGWGLFLGSSMPIRDADIFAARTPARVAANRGASGIDGTLASACGFAAGLGAPVALLVGDLAALHDLNAMMLLRQADPPLLVVVVNNDGGGIFHFLPVTAETDRFEAWFGTPHGLDLAVLARGFGIETAEPRDPVAFRAVLADAAARPRNMLVQVRTERVANRERHRALDAAVQAALDAVPGLAPA
jgi:2-succinyl-5-enolpyruvyl-6-hydroxy-3-cyclohexene-1-carboxylate synthase